jgi:hypothetical protein
MFWGLWAPILLAIGSVYRYKQLKKLDINRVRKDSAHKVAKLSIENNQQEPTTEVESS